MASTLQWWCVWTSIAVARRVFRSCWKMTRTSKYPVHTAMLRWFARQWPRIVSYWRSTIWSRSIRSGWFNCKRRMNPWRKAILTSWKLLSWRRTPKWLVLSFWPWTTPPNCLEVQPCSTIFPLPNPSISLELPKSVGKICWLMLRGKKLSNWRGWQNRKCLLIK